MSTYKLAYITLWLYVLTIPFDSAFVLPGLGTLNRLLGITAVVVGVLVLMYNRRFHRLSPFHLLMALFTVWVVATFFWSILPVITQRKMYIFFQRILSVWLIWEFARRRSRQEGLMQAYVLGAIVLAGSLLYEYVTRPAYIDKLLMYRYVAFDDNPNEIAFVMCLGIPLAWYSALVQHKKLLKWLNLVYIPLGSYAIFLTASRSALITLVFALLIIPFTYTKLSRTARVLFSLTIPVAMVAAIMYVPTTSWNRIDTLREAVSGEDIRFTIWKVGYSALQEKPLQGIGFAAYRGAVKAEIGKGYVAHNTFISVMVEEGIIGFFIFMAMLCVLVFKGRRLPMLQKRMWLIILLAWAVGSSAATWEHKKSTWFFLGLAAAQVYLFHQDREPRSSSAVAYRPTALKSAS